MVAALNFHLFHAHAERVHMTNIAQMVNVLRAMILADKDRMLLTPTYHALHLYVPFQDATSLPTIIKESAPYTFGGTTIAGLSASAARAKDGRLYLAMVNTNPSVPAEVSVNVGGRLPTSATGRLLTARSMDDHNTFSCHALCSRFPSVPRLSREG